jgi:microcystin-dependent protein
MNKANYTERPQRSFPLSTEGLDFIQRQILLAAEYAKSAGGNYILSGCTVTGTNVSSGTVILNGELLPFVGGTRQTTVRIVEKNESITAGSETYDGAYVHRYVDFGSNLNDVDTFNFSDLKLFPTNKFLSENYATKSELATLQGLVLPKRGIIMWSGTIADIPNGFVLCDGRTVSGFGAVPDLRGRFIVGYYSKRDDEPSASSDLLGDYGSIGTKGGAKQVTLTTAQMPSHTHTTEQFSRRGYPDDSGDRTNDYYFIDGSKDNVKSSLSINGAGGGQAHENRPPYFVLAFIIKVV